MFVTPSPIWTTGCIIFHCPFQSFQIIGANLFDACINFGILDQIIGANDQGAHVLVCGAHASAAWISKQWVIAIFILSSVVLKADAGSAYVTTKPLTCSATHLDYLWGGSG